MIRTEEEARKCWCPFARGAAPTDSQYAATAGNRWPDGDGSQARCIASECMAWRQGPPPAPNWIGYSGADYATRKTEPERPQHVSASWWWEGAIPDETTAGWREPPEEAANRRGGYCGLAGAAV